MFSTTKPRSEKAVLIRVQLKNNRNKSPWSSVSSLDELTQLTHNANAEVVGKVTQKLDHPSPYYLGKGKLQELIEMKQKVPYDTVIVDDELSPLQQKNLEEVLKVKVIDRTALILDIFAKRASTKEGRLQVELAQHQYLLPRLTGQWSHLERLGGGIGTRGPGESQLETDRRLIKEKIKRLEKEIEEVRKHRSLYRQKRKSGGISIVALVGYTNSGKSTLLNTIGKANVIAEDRLFATLDPVTRRIALPDGSRVLLTDTVGFIQKLPPALITAFRATLEELDEADLLIHVVDITHRDVAEQCSTVESILERLDLKEKPVITALNKIDRILDYSELEHAEQLSHQLTDNFHIAKGSFVIISASLGWRVDNLLTRIQETLHSQKLFPD